MSGRPDEQHASLGWAVAGISAGLVGFEISLMRLLLVVSWHHFAFLVISIVLLGLGTSGTALCLARRWAAPRSDQLLWLLALATSVSMPVCTMLSQGLSIESQFVPALFWWQIGRWTGFWLILSIPFFLGGMTCGLALMTAHDKIPLVYAANLMGSACGGLVAVACMPMLPAEWLPVAMGGLGLVGAAGLCRGASRTDPVRRWLPGRIVALAACVLAVTMQLVISPPELRHDSNKYAATLALLEEQGSARSLAKSFGARGLVQAYEGDVFHEMPFLAVGETPPSMLALTIDGHWAGSILRIRDREQAGVCDNTLMASAYALSSPRPRVLLLGEVTGVNVWLATRQNAESVTMVQPNRQLVDLLRGPLRELGGAALVLPRVKISVAEPRHFVESTDERFDVIQLVTLEGTAAGTGGLGGLAEDHLITVEGVWSCLDRLTENGIIFACRGIQTPPRDGPKLLATIVEALRRKGISVPGRHIVVVRDYLGVCTIAKMSPWTSSQIDGVRKTCADRQLTPVWFDGIRIDELNKPDELPAPPDKIGDWYHYAARQLLAGIDDSFFDEWPFAIRPATDDRPFFHDFCRLDALGSLRRHFGEVWLTRTELAFPFVIGATVMVSAAGVLLTLLPLAFAGIRTTMRRRVPAAGYFATIGLAYLLLEMTYLSRLTILLGGPVQAAALTVSAFLFASGLGSLTAQRYSFRSSRINGGIFIALVTVGLLELTIMDRAISAACTWGPAARCAAAIAAIVPLAYLMGFPMPSGLSRLNDASPAMIPWAWGINGFASVLAAPLAVLIAMTWGYRAAGATALLLYLVAGGLHRFLPNANQASTIPSRIA